MRINEDTIIVGESVFLVPYRHEHVAKYHEWMASPELQEATASEPLSMEEEYEMQRSWHLDEDKLTFIVLLRENSEERPDPLTRNMVGDVNLFLSPHPLQTEDNGDTSHSTDMQGELEIMIAEPSARRKGCATQALSLMLRYALSKKLVRRPQDFLVRIGERNTRSIDMFRKLGFEVVKRVAVFEEVEMRITSAEAVDKWIQGSLKPLQILQC